MVLSLHYSIKSVVTEFTLGSVALTSYTLDKFLQLFTLVSQSLKYIKYYIYLTGFVFGMILDNAYKTFSREFRIY